MVKRAFAIVLGRVSLILDVDVAGGTVLQMGIAGAMLLYLHFKVYRCLTIHVQIPLCPPEQGMVQSIQQGTCSVRLEVVI